MEQEVLEYIKDLNNQVVNLIELNKSMITPILAESKALRAYVNDLEKENLELKSRNNELKTKLKLETFDLEHRIQVMERRFKAMNE